MVEASGQVVMVTSQTTAYGRLYYIRQSDLLPSTLVQLQTQARHPAWQSRQGWLCSVPQLLTQHNHQLMGKQMLKLGTATVALVITN